jgi:hypothetical protein
MTGDNPHRKFTKEEMLDALERSGYPMEQRVESLLISQGFEVEPNHRYRDPESGSAREIDIRAHGLVLAGEETEQLFAASIVFVECENNSQPVVVFTKPERVDQANIASVKQSGVLSNFWSHNTCEPTAVRIDMASFHHVCRTPTATQYCTFHKPKSGGPVLATHDDRHHGTLDSLTKAIECEMERDLVGWDVQDLGEGGYINTYSGVVVLQGELLAAFRDSTGLCMREISHAILAVRRPGAWPGPSDTHLVDIIREDYAESYFSDLRSESQRLASELRRRKDDISRSREHLQSMLRGLQPRPESFREFLVPRWWEHFARNGGLWFWETPS